MKHHRAKNWAKWEAKRDYIWIVRDRRECLICGKRAGTVVHHILSRGAHKEVWLDERNLCTLCQEHHDEYANTVPMIINLIRQMRTRFPEYDYTEFPYRGYLED